MYVYSGSSAPSSPVTDQLWYHTTYKQLFRYDSGVDSGSWLSVQVFRANFMNANATSTNQVSWTDIQAQNAADFDIYIEDMVGAARVITTNDGSNFWTFFLSRRSANNTDTAIANFTTASDSVNTWTPHKQSVSVFIDVSAVDAKEFLLTMGKTGLPGTVSASTGFNFRVVIPK